MKKSIRLERVNPILKVKDLSVSRKYYVKALGFKEAEWGRNMKFTVMERDNCSIYLCEGGQGCVGTWLWVGFDGDMDTLHQELKSAGAIIRRPPKNYSWALELQVEDPDGHILRFGTEPNATEPFMDNTDF